mmetsp:Transcript_42446/g.66457  ORF Transcript_42446/g.66457 Transcript_42446/m.66457 type:complete len:216 (-) Transcript_42446:629-1276(-)
MTRPLVRHVLNNLGVPKYRFWGCQSILLRCPGGSKILALHLAIHKELFTHLLLCPHDHLVNVGSRHLKDLGQTLGDHQPVGHVFGHVSVLVVGVMKTVFACGGWVSQASVAGIGPHGGPEVGLVGDVVPVALHVPVVDVGDLVQVRAVMIRDLLTQTADLSGHGVEHIGGLICQTLIKEGALGETLAVPLVPLPIHDSQMHDLVDGSQCNSQNVP